MRIAKNFGPIVQCIFSIELCKKHMLIPIKGPENRSYQNYIHSSKKHNIAGQGQSSAFLLRVKKLLAISFSTLILLQYNWASECEYTMYIYRHSAVETFNTISFFSEIKKCSLHFFSNYNLMDCIEEASFLNESHKLTCIYAKFFRSYCWILKKKMLILD